MYKGSAYELCALSGCPWPGEKAMDRMIDALICLERGKVKISGDRIFDLSSKSDKYKSTRHTTHELIVASALAGIDDKGSEGEI